MTKKKKIVMLSLVLLLLLGGGAAYFFLVMKKPDEAKEAKKEPVNVEEITLLTVPIDPITTNLKTSKSYVVATFSVQLDSEEAKTEFVARLPEMKNLIILTLHATERGQLEAPEGIQALTDSLAHHMNQAMTHGKVAHVFVTDFKTQ